MSAFYDIWISAQDEPAEYKRGGNSAWEKSQEGIWWSLPGNREFITEVSIANYHLVLIGQLYEKITDDELLKRCADYIENPQKDFDEPAGHYILFLLDGNRKETHVFTNRLGSYHAYWSADKIVSTCYLALAKSKTDKQLDWQGITGFMAMGYFPEDKTYLEGISIFEPASHYCFDEQLNLLSKKRFWQWRYEPTHKPIEDYSDRLHEILQSSLSIAVRDKKTVIPISGGLDSRLLAGELTMGNKMPYTILQGLSYGYTTDSSEITIAKEIAAKREIPLHAYKMPDYLFEQLDEITEAVELFQYVDGTRQASASEWLRDNADVVVGGHWGDVWMDSMHVENGDELQNLFQNKIIKKGATWLLENICEPRVKNGSNYLNDYFNTFMNKYSDIVDADFRMKIYKTEQWSFRWTTASTRMYQAASFPILPFYDKRIVDLFTTIPVEEVKDRNLEIAYLKQYHKDLAKITWQEYDADLYSYRYFNNRNIAYRAYKKIQNTVTGKKPIQRNWEVFYLNPGGRKNLEQFLLGNTLLDEIVPEVKVNELLDSMYEQPNAANGYSVSMLLTFALFLKQVYG